MMEISNAPVTRLAIGWLTMFVIGTDLFVVSPLLPLIAADYRISPSLAGLGVALFALTYMISCTPPRPSCRPDRTAANADLLPDWFRLGQSADRLGREFHLAALRPD